MHRVIQLAGIGLCVDYILKVHRPCIAHPELLLQHGYAEDFTETQSLIVLSCSMLEPVSIQSEK